MKLLKVLNNTILLEVSEKLKKSLLSKFSGETTDSEEVIVSNIDDFEKYKQGLPIDKRDITKYSYDELKELIQSKVSARTLDDIFSDFKKREEGIENNTLKRYIKKFLEIQSELPKEKQKISKYSFLNLVKLINDSYTRLLTKKMMEKFSSENPNLTKDQILFYIDSYIENFDSIPFNSKSIDKMTFSELEHLLDGLEGKKTIGDVNKNDFGDIPLKYDENNLKIFAPTTKDQCIRLKNGRSWCTSREGVGNLYYNYRLGQKRTLYYVIDEDKSFDDLNFAVVILVEPSGQMAMADKSNSGRFGGSTNLFWNEIVDKVPKLYGLQHIFKPKPLTKYEKKLVNIASNAQVGENPMKSFSNPQEVEMWLEYKSPKLSDKQYSNLTANLKKKYIGLGMSLSANMIQSSEPEVLSYYISKKIESFKKITNLNDLSLDDIALLNTPILKKLKEEMKIKFTEDSEFKGDNINIIFPRDRGSKYVALYGFDDLLENLPDDIHSFVFENKSDIILKFDLPPTIERFKNLETLVLMKCVKSIPEEIGNLKKLRFLLLDDNLALTTLPKSITQLPNLDILGLNGCDNITFPKNFENYFKSVGDNLFEKT